MRARAACTEEADRVGVGPGKVNAARQLGVDPVNPVNSGQLDRVGGRDLTLAPSEESPVRPRVLMGSDPAELGGWKAEPSPTSSAGPTASWDPIPPRTPRPRVADAEDEG